jgi:archaellum component FlaC
MSVGISTYVVTVIFFCSLLYGVMVINRKPKGKKAEYLQMEDLEATGWELVEDIKNASDAYTDKIQGVKKEIEGKIEELMQVEERFEAYRDYEELLSQKQEVLEELYDKVRREVVASKVEKEIKQAPSAMERVQAKVNAMIEQEKTRARVVGESVGHSDIEEKKEQIYRLYEGGLTINEISEATGTEKGFVQVLVNMKNYKKK